MGPGGRLQGDQAGPSPTGQLPGPVQVRTWRYVDGMQLQPAPCGGLPVRIWPGIIVMLNQLHYFLWYI